MGMGTVMLADSTLRTRIGYDIAVRYATPLWRIGVAYRPACAAGLWLLLSRAPRRAAGRRSNVAKFPLANPPPSRQRRTVRPSGLTPRLGGEGGGLAPAGVPEPAGSECRNGADRPG
jgi:hypothetical protein